MFKKSFSLMLILIFSLSNFLVLDANAIKIVSKEYSEQLNKDISLWDMFNYFWELYDWKIPDSYKYIDVKISWVKKDSKLYNNIQKLIYVNVLNNRDVYLNIYKKINAYNFYTFAWKNFNTNLILDSEIKGLKSRNAIVSDFDKINNKLKVNVNSFEFRDNLSNINKKKEIFSDVYNTLSNKYYWRDSLDKTKMISEATKALAESTWDKFTKYFPPVDNKSFNEALTWKYEWIWAYVDMEKPGEFKIISPISGSPAESAWLKWWDVVLKVDDKKITEKNWINEVISWIKWPAWTEVKLTIQRWKNIFDIIVKRDSIVIKEIDAKKINSNTLYIKMKFFWPNISKEFKDSLEILKTDKNIKKIIFDLRWDWGWYLNQVSDILSNFVPEWESTAIVKYYDWNQNYKSRWYDDIDFSKYKLITLQNWWTASASEIFIWTLKDYYPDITIIWEQSYWKGSVQTIKQYRDGSSLKYTIAKWYTWKTENWIDWIWIKPDILMKMEKYWVPENKDLQLQKALKLK